MADVTEPPSPPAPEPTPRQRETLDRLRRGDRPDHDPALSSELATFLDDELGAAAEVLSAADDKVFISKYTLGGIHACEAFHVADADAGFAWTVATARGTVSHKAIELGNNAVGRRGGEVPPPGELVDWALESLIDGDSGPRDLDRFLDTIGPAEAAQLRAQVTGIVSHYFDGFPPLPKGWRPVYEARVAHHVRRRITLQGKTDLTIGAPHGTTAGRVIIDFKTGNPWAGNRDDLRFYALLDTIKTGVPPFRVATHYLESGELDIEDITPDVLWAAARRVVDGVAKVMSITHHGRPPTATPGPRCGWCPIAATCEVAFGHLADDADPA